VKYFHGILSGSQSHILADHAALAVDHIIDQLLVLIPSLTLPLKSDISGFAINHRHTPLEESRRPASIATVTAMRRPSPRGRLCQRRIASTLPVSFRRRGSGCNSPPTRPSIGGPLKQIATL